MGQVWLSGSALIRVHKNNDVEINIDMLIDKIKKLIKEL